MLIRVGLLGYVNQVGIMSEGSKFQLSSLSRTYFSDQVGRTTGTVIIELPQSS